MITRDCGDCTLCCKLFEVDELAKPANVLCGHCDGKRCQIYNRRPQMCAEFNCMYRVNNALGDYWYPLTSHIVIRTYGDDDAAAMFFTVDPAYPDAWRAAPFYDEIIECATYGLKHKLYSTEVHVGDKVFPIVPPGFVRGINGVHQGGYDLMGG